MLTSPASSEEISDTKAMALNQRALAHYKSECTCYSKVFGLYSVSICSKIIRSTPRHSRSTGWGLLAIVIIARMMIVTKKPLPGVDRLSQLSVANTFINRLAIRRHCTRGSSFIIYVGLVGSQWVRWRGSRRSCAKDKSGIILTDRTWHWFGKFGLFKLSNQQCELRYWPVGCLIDRLGINMI